MYAILIDNTFIINDCLCIGRLQADDEQSATWTVRSQVDEKRPNRPTGVLAADFRGLGTGSALASGNTPSVPERSARKLIGLGKPHLTINRHCMN